MSCERKGARSELLRALYARNAIWSSARLGLESQNGVIRRKRALSEFLIFVFRLEVKGRTFQIEDFRFEGNGKGRSRLRQSGRRCAPFFYPALKRWAMERNRLGLPSVGRGPIKNRKSKIKNISASCVSWSGTALGGGIGGLVEHFEDSVDGDTDPVGAVFEFVFDLDECLLQEVSAEQDVNLPARCGEEGCFVGGLQIFGDEDAADPLVPGLRPEVELRVSGFVRDDARNVSVENGVRDIVEGADHSGDIAESGSLDAAFAHGTREFSFEIGDQDIVADEEYLGEIQVSVLANTPSA